MPDTLVNIIGSMNAELAHNLAIRVLRSKFIPKPKLVSPPNLSANLIGFQFPNPLAVSAGFDKNGVLVDALLNIGFGFVEIGTVTPKAQYGNTKPRVFRLNKDQAVINRLGFNNQGAEKVIDNLTNRHNASGILGINIGANKDSKEKIADYVAGIKFFSKLANYLTINISSPNTPGLRTLQGREELTQLLQAINNEREQQSQKIQRTIPIFLKIAPDINNEQLEDICELVLSEKINGLVISNTTLDRSNLQATQIASESGGLSGRPLFEKSTILLAKARHLVGPELLIIGVGGIDSGKAAWEKIQAGANLLQIYTGLVFQGYQLADEIISFLSKKVVENKFTNLQNAVGMQTEIWRNKQIS